MENNNIFDGFMPSINDVSISKISSSITSNGDLVMVHCVTIKTLEKEYVFSISPENLAKFYFLILKTLCN